MFFTINNKGRNNMKEIKILVVDDSKDNIEAAREFFCSVGYQEEIDVYFRATPDDAIILIDDAKIDFAFIDLEMELSNGVIDKAAGHKLSVYSWRKNVPIVILTHKSIKPEGSNHGAPKTAKEVIISEFAGSDVSNRIYGSKANSDTWNKIWQDKKTIEHIKVWIFNAKIAKRENADIWEYIKEMFYVGNQEISNFFLSSTGTYPPMMDFWKQGKYTYIDK